MKKDNFFKILPFDIEHHDKNHTDVRFSFECSTHGTFTETVRFGSFALTRASALLLNSLSWLLSLSYYKICAHKDVSGPLFAEQPECIKDLIYSCFQDGMAEFYIRNDLPYPYPLNISFSKTNAPIDDNSSDEKPSFTPSTALCAYGGGKDTFVALTLLNKQNISATPTSVYISDITKNVLQDSWSKAAPLLSNKNSLSTIKRALDPKLISLSKDGKGYTGHIPITAINSFLLILQAYFLGKTFVVFANEDSASEETLSINGHKANHQYSKSLQMERLFQTYLSDLTNVLNDDLPYYFSILRPYSELRIASLFSDEKYLHPHVISCNRNFSSTNPLDRGERWCKKCPKCAFSALILSSFLNKDEIDLLFGENLLLIEDLIPHLKDLLGLTDKKPWECVGTVDESRAAFWHYIQTGHATNSALDKLYSELLDTISEEELKMLYSKNIEFKGFDLFPNTLNFYY